MSSNELKNLEDFKELCTDWENPEKGKSFDVRIPTGFKDLDSFLDGGLRKGLTIITAPPASGKTAITVQMMANMAKTKTAVLYFNFDNDKDEIFSRFVCLESYQQALEMMNPFNADRAAKPYGQLLTIQDKFDLLTNTDKKVYHAGVKAVKEYAPYMRWCEQVRDVHEIKRIADRIHGQLPEENRGRMVVFVDYMQSVPTVGKGEWENLGEIAKVLGSIRYCPVIGLSSISKATAKTWDEGNMFSSYGSSGFAFKAQMVLNLKPDGKKESVQKMNLEVAKNRCGDDNETFSFKFYRRHGFFEEVPKLPRVARDDMGI